MRIPIRYAAASPSGHLPGDPRPREEARDETPFHPADRAERAGQQSGEADEPAEALRRQLERALREASQLEKDFSNYRRHAEAKLAGARAAATADVLAELGDALHGLEAAIAAAQRDPTSVRQGVELVARGIRAVYERHGLERIPTEGEIFDPRLHEATLVEHRPGVEQGRVVRELSPGFRTAERVVRPAKVAVAA